METFLPLLNKQSMSSWIKKKKKKAGLQIYIHTRLLNTSDYDLFKLIQSADDYFILKRFWLLEDISETNDDFWLLSKKVRWKSALLDMEPEMLFVENIYVNCKCAHKTKQVNHWRLS